MTKKLNYFLICENAIIDQTNKVSIINTYDKLITTGFPLYQGKIYFVTSIVFDGLKATDSRMYPMFLTFKDSSGKDFLPGVSRINFQMNVNPHPNRQISTVINLVDPVIFTKADRYTFSCYDEKEEKVADFILDVAKE